MFVPVGIRRPSESCRVCQNLVKLHRMLVVCVGKMTYQKLDRPSEGRDEST